MVIRICGVQWAILVQVSKVQWLKKKTKTKKIHHSKQNDTQYTTDLNSTSTQKTQKMESIPLKESLVTGTESPGDTLGVYKYVTKQKNKE